MAQHPDDVEMEREGKEQAARFGDDLLQGKEAELRALVTTYADGDAEDALWRLREWFWGGALQERAERETTKESA